MPKHRLFNKLSLSVGIILIFTFIWLSSESNANSERLDQIPPPFLEYQIYNDTIYEYTEAIPIMSGGWGNLNPLYEHYNLCDLLLEGEINEVWIWAGTADGEELAHLLEWYTSGPTWGTSWIPGSVPNCGEIVTTMVYNYTREAGESVHSYGHRMEALLAHQAETACDFHTNTWPWPLGLPVGHDSCPEDQALDDRYAYVARAFEGNDNIAGCGNVHYPPNISKAYQDEFGSSAEYRYDSLILEDTICPDWSMDGSATVSQVNCEDWACSQPGYQIWWMQNFPGYQNTNRNRAGEYHQNWWELLFGGDIFAPEPTPSPTPTATATPPPTSSPTLVPTDTPTHTPTPTSTPDPPAMEELKQHIYLPFIADMGADNRKMPPDMIHHIATHPDRYVTGGNQRTQDSLNLETMRINSNIPEAVHKPVVFVINLPAYRKNGESLRNIRAHTEQLIHNLKLSTIYHGYLYDTFFTMDFLGQDGASYAPAEGCGLGDSPDSVHIRLKGMRPDVEPVNIRLSDATNGGYWESSCPSLGRRIHVIQNSPDQADLYFKPYRFIPVGSQFELIVDYSDESRDILRFHSTSDATPMSRVLEAEFIGQDGESFAGHQCHQGTAPDNVHIRLTEMRKDVEPLSYKVIDHTGGFTWDNPCDPQTQAILHVIRPEPGVADVYFKPGAAAPDGRIYTIELRYSDGINEVVEVAGTAISP